jgi:hypothetical protein
MAKGRVQGFEKQGFEGSRVRGFEGSRKKGSRVQGCWGSRDFSALGIGTGKFGNGYP